jgi:hypothetical protein
MNRKQLIQSAKQLDTAAIAILLNQSLVSRRVEVIEAAIEEDLLQLKLRSKKAPDRHKVVPFLVEELKTLGIEAIERVTVHGFVEDSVNLLWEETLTLSRENSLIERVTKINAMAPVAWETPAEETEEKVDGPASSRPPRGEASEGNSRPDEPETREPLPAALNRKTPASSTRNILSSGVILAFWSLGFGFGLFAGTYVGYQKAAIELSPTSGVVERSP